jgi:RimJ/RimL family protein N-acetyltransferase
VTMETHVASGLSEWLRGTRDLPGQLWVGDGDRRIAGCIGVTGRSPDIARLRWFVVDPAHRGKGLGGGLLAEAMGFVRASGYRRVELETFSELAGAARLYKSVGFERTGAERREFCGRLVDMEWYALEL